MTRHLPNSWIVESRRIGVDGRVVVDDDDGFKGCPAGFAPAVD